MPVTVGDVIDRLMEFNRDAEITEVVVSGQTQDAAFPVQSMTIKGNEEHESDSPCVVIYINAE